MSWSIVSSIRQEPYIFDEDFCVSVKCCCGHEFFKFDSSKACGKFDFAVVCPDCKSLLKYEIRESPLVSCNLYYAVSIAGDSANELPFEIQCLIDSLGKLAKLKEIDQLTILQFCGLDFKLCKGSKYKYVLSFQRKFKIFIADRLLNENTPRILICIYDRECFFNAMVDSFQFLKEILNKFNLQINNVYPVNQKNKRIGADKH